MNEGALARSPAARQVVAPDVDWRDAVTKVTWIPEEYRDPSVAPEVAMRMLRCSRESLTQLEQLGLPSADTPDGPRYDLCDLKNVGMYSGTGMTEVEKSMAVLLGFTKLPKEELIGPRRYSYRLRLLSAAEPGARLIRRVYRPSPEVTGGALHTCNSDGRTVEVDGDFFRMAQSSEATGALTVLGSEHTIRSPLISQVFADLVESGVRWHYLPQEYSLHIDRAFAAGAGNCAVLCAVLERRLIEGGYEARAYHGWMAAVSEMDHGWVEVVDDDGIVKSLNPSLALLALHNGFGNRELYELVAGSRLNRIIPTRAPLYSPFVHDAGTCDDTTSFRCTVEDGEPGGSRRSRLTERWRARAR